MSYQTALTTEQQKLSNLWNEHVRAEFDAHRPDQKIKTRRLNAFIRRTKSTMKTVTGALSKPEQRSSFADSLQLWAWVSRLW